MSRPFSHFIDVCFSNFFLYKDGLEKYNGIQQMITLKEKRENNEAE